MLLYRRKDLSLSIFENNYFHFILAPYIAAISSLNKLFRAAKNVILTSKVLAISRAAFFYR